MMDLPQPPAEQELKNIIDKLAQFVARNGPEFEQMTKQKQKDNPKFSFLFGGEFFNYYQYRVTTEQAIIKQKQRTIEQQQAIVQHVVNQQSIQSAPWQQSQQPQPQPQQPPPDIHEQIRQSEQNLAAQHQLLLQQQQVQVDDAIRKAQDEKIANLAKECSINIEELDGVLQPIIGSCTKDSISGGKGWIFGHAISPVASEVTVQYILKKVTAPGTSFEAKLHLVYLLNDVLHHCVRKNADDLKKTLDRLVVPIFCSTSMGAAPEKQQKLHKLYKLWETNKYFSQQVLDQLQNPVSSLASYQASLIAEFASLITPITAAIQAQYSMLQKQHQDFVTHLTNPVHHIQQLPYAFQSSQNPLMALRPSPAAPYNMVQQSQQAPPPPHLLQGQQPQQQQQQPMPQPMMTQPQQQPQTHPNDSLVQQVATSSPALVEAAPPQIPMPQQSTDDCQSPFPQNPPSSSEQQPPTSINPNNVPLPSAQNSGQGPPTTDCNLPDIPPPGQRYLGPPHGEHGGLPSRPPNGQPHAPHFADDYSPQFGGPQHMGYVEPPDYNITPPHMGSYGHSPHYGPPRGLPLPLNQHDMPTHHGHPDFIDPMLPPTIPPYYDLPAGLMVPLVKLEDTDFNSPLDPNDIRLPPPALPTERLIAAVELFYSPPSHDRARNSEGWEQLGLYEYFKAKSQAKKQKQGLPDNVGSGDDSQEASAFHFGGEPVAPVSFSEKHVSRRRYREFKSPDKAPDLEQISRNDPPTITKPSVGLLGDRPRSRSRSRSRSPPPPRHRSPQHRPSYNRRSPRSRSPSPNERERDRGRDRDRGRKRTPEKSPTPPSFFGGAYPSTPLDRRLDESNKGHQLLKKMGWGGAGLGAAEQGIQDPVESGDVRDRQDMYKGIGINLNDPYENFRKSKGQAFINRMKARAEELGKM